MSEERAKYFLVNSIEEKDIIFTIETYICSTCMGDLIPINQNGKWFVVCKNCGENTREYISKHWKNQAGKENPKEKQA